MKGNGTEGYRGILLLELYILKYIQQNFPFIPSGWGNRSLLCISLYSFAYLKEYVNVKDEGRQKVIYDLKFNKKK